MVVVEVWEELAAAGQVWEGLARAACRGFTGLSIVLVDNIWFFYLS